MSYILDALKRSEQEEKIRQTPALDAVHIFRTTRSTNPTFTILLVAALAVATGAAFYLFNQDTQRTGMTNPVSTAMSQREKFVPSRQMESSEKLVSANSILAEKRTTEPVIATPVRITDLPEGIQLKIPEMRFSSHIFAEDSSLRLVNINGNNVREGSNITDEILLLKITEEGVIVRYRDYIFEMSVLRDWTLD